MSGLFSDAMRLTGGDTDNEVMLAFNLEGSRRVDPADVEARSGKVLVDVEGRFAIAVRGRIVFETNGFLVMAFGLELARWVEGVSNGRLRDLEYTSMDFDEGPLLSFLAEDGRGWRIESPWRHGPWPVIVEQGPLLAASERFLETLKAYLLQKHGIPFMAYLRAQ